MQETQHEEQEMALAVVRLNDIGFIPVYCAAHLRQYARIECGALLNRDVFESRSFDCGVQFIGSVVASDYPPARSHHSARNRRILRRTSASRPCKHEEWLHRARYRQRLDDG